MASRCEEATSGRSRSALLEHLRHRRHPCPSNCRQQMDLKHAPEWPAASSLLAGVCRAGCAGAPCMQGVYHMHADCGDWGAHLAGPAAGVPGRPPCIPLDLRSTTAGCRCLPAAASPPAPVSAHCGPGNCCVPTSASLLAGRLQHPNVSALSAPMPRPSGQVQAAAPEVFYVHHLPHHPPWKNEPAQGFHLAKCMLPKDSTKEYADWYT